MEQQLITLAYHLVAIVCVCVVFFAVLIGYDHGLSKKARAFRKQQKKLPKCYKN
jgi:hypothetical protein